MRTAEPTLRGAQHPAQQPSKRSLAAGMPIADAAKNRVNVLLEALDPRTREVIRMRTGLSGQREMTLEQIGQHFGITKERVRQINVRGMKQLRERAAQEAVELP